MQPLVYVVILNWNAKNYLKNCLDSVLKSDYRNFRVIFVDNASTDGSPEFVKRLYKKQIHSKRLILILNEKNLGVPEGNNVGIRLAMESKPDYIALLNPDTIVTRNWLSSLVSEISSDRNLGAVQSKMLSFDKKTIDSTGITIFNSLIMGVDRGQGEKDSGKYDDERELIAICGAGAIYRESALNDIKMSNDYLDSDFFCYWEDADLSLRLFHRGWKQIYCPDAVMYHGRSALTGKSSPFSAYYLHRNNFWFVIKNMPLLTIVKKSPYIISLNTLLFFGFIFFRRNCFFPFLRAKLDSLAGIGKMLGKRKIIMSSSRVDRKNIEKLIDKKIAPASFFK